MSEEFETETELLFEVPRGVELPHQIVLFEFGITETVKGDFLFDEVSAESVMRHYEDGGIDRLPFGVAHLMVPRPDGNGGVRISENPEAHKAYGWFVPAIVDNPETGTKALMATSIEWTKAGSDALLNREFRFFSPAIDFERESRRVTRLINVALTNLPATKNQRPLVLDALEAETNNNQKETEKQMTALLDSLGAPDEASAVAKVGELKSAVTELQGLLSAFDVESVGAATEAISQLKKTANAGIEAQAQLSAIIAERAQEKREAAIELLCAEGKILENQRKFAAGLSEEQFETYVATLSANPVLTGKSISEPEAPKGDGRIEGASFNASELFPSIGENK